jgi:hypothetical protein
VPVYSKKRRVTFAGNSFLTPPVEFIMDTISTDSYKGWNITVTSKANMCAHFSFDITDPVGKTQHVKMGGENEQRAFERAREMIDMEIAFADEE